MLIINADDLGRTVTATDNSITCYKRKGITAASAMVFMKDSRRAAESALAAGLETGLHLNLDLPFDSSEIGPRLLKGHSRMTKYFCRGKWTDVLYNPFLRKDFDYVFKAQYEEFFRLFGKEPAQIDGHHHRHLCANMLIDHILPLGVCLRRNFSFEPGEKSIINRSYRLLVDRWLARRYSCTDAFFSIEPIQDMPRLVRIVSRAYSSHVELMVHPARAEQYEYLISNQFRDLIASVPTGGYHMLSHAKKKD